MKKRLTPPQIMKLIEEGNEHLIPKSKTWHRFREICHRQEKLSPAAWASRIGIPLTSMDKFMLGTHIIASHNIKKIQEYIDSYASGECNGKEKKE